MLRFCAALLAAAQLLPLKPDAAQQATFTTAVSQAVVRPGDTVSLWVDVTPKPKMHVYGPGAKGYFPITLTLTPPAGAIAGTVSYPRPAVVFFPAFNERTPVYSKPFRIAQPVTIARTARPGAVLTFSGVVKYQACDDALCYPPSSAVVSWGVKVG